MLVSMQPTEQESLKRIADALAIIALRANADLQSEERRHSCPSSMLKEVKAAAAYAEKIVNRSPS